MASMTLLEMSALLAEEALTLKALLILPLGRSTERPIFMKVGLTICMYSPSTCA